MCAEGSRTTVQDQTQTPMTSGRLSMFWIQGSVLTHLGRGLKIQPQKYLGKNSNQSWFWFPKVCKASDVLVEVCIAGQLQLCLNKKLLPPPSQRLLVISIHNFMNTGR